jgi:phosphate transport system substrate-binding protein
VVNWRDIQGSRGSDQTVQVITRESDSVTRRLFDEQILGEDRLTPNARVFSNSKAIVDFVSQYPEAIGYVGLANVTDQVKVVSIEEIAPTAETVTNGAYPLTQLLYLVTPSNPSNMIQEFTKFALGPAGQSIVSGMGLGRIN